MHLIRNIRFSEFPRFVVYALTITGFIIGILAVSGVESLKGLGVVGGGIITLASLIILAGMIAWTKKNSKKDLPNLQSLPPTNLNELTYIDANGNSHKILKNSIVYLKSGESSRIDELMKYIPPGASGKIYISNNLYYLHNDNDRFEINLKRKSLKENTYNFLIHPRLGLVSYTGPSADLQPL